MARMPFVSEVFPIVLEALSKNLLIMKGDFCIEFIRTNHSIADASALAIITPCGIVIHTGDFKVDYTPIDGAPIDLMRFAELGEKGTNDTRGVICMFLFCRCKHSQQV